MANHEHTREAERGRDEGRPGHRDPSAAHGLLWDGGATKPEVSCQQQGLRASQRWCKQGRPGGGGATQTGTREPHKHRGSSLRPPGGLAPAREGEPGWLPGFEQPQKRCTAGWRPSARLGSVSGAKSQRPWRQAAGGGGPWALGLGAAALNSPQCLTQCPPYEGGLSRAGGEPCPSDVFS